MSALDASMTGNRIACRVSRVERKISPPDTRHPTRLRLVCSGYIE